MEKNLGQKSFALCNERLLWLIILVVGALLRVLFIGSYPSGLNQDEASIGYEAWSLLKYGIDRNGNAWPVLFVSWGSGQNVLYAYLSMPFIALLGLTEFSIRLLSAVLGTATLCVLYSLAKHLRGVGFALLAMAVLAVTPWHVMASRWALESNILPFFLLLGLYFLVLGVQRQWFLVPAAATFALSLYAYGIAFVFIPPFFLLCLVYFYFKHALHAKPLLAAGGVFLLIALPITLCNVLNMAGGEQLRMLGLTLPKLTEARQAATMGFSGGDIWWHFKELLRLLATGNDGLVNNTLGRGQLLLPGGMLLALLGVALSIRAAAKGFEKDRGELLVLFMLAVAFACSLLIDVNINRVNFIWLPLVYFSCRGLAALGAWLLRFAQKRGWRFGRRVLAAVCAVYLAAVLPLLGWQYVRQYSPDENVNNPGLGSALRYANGLQAGEIYMTDRLLEPYIFALFYNQTPPAEFAATVRYEDEQDGFRYVEAYTNYTFGGGFTPTENTVYVLRQEQAHGLVILAEYNEFVVAVAP